MRRRDFITLLGTSAATWPLPAMYQWPETAEEGGLMGYGPRITQM